jgi:hypothetical protein
LQQSPGDINTQITNCWKIVAGTTIVAQDNKYSDIGEIHTGHDVDARFEYGQTADSNFDVGASTGGGAWKLSGNYHVGNGGSTKITWYVPHDFGHRLQTQFHIVKRKITYTAPNNGTPCPPDYDAFPKSWNTGVLDGQDNSFLDYHCRADHAPYNVWFKANSALDRTSSKSYHFGGAINLFGLISIGVDSGYSQWVTAHWEFHSGQPYHSMCGSDDYIPTAHRIFAGWG